jgi:hypothetical protein
MKRRVRERVVGTSVEDDEVGRELIVVCQLRTLLPMADGGKRTRDSEHVTDTVTSRISDQMCHHRAAALVFF